MKKNKKKDTSPIAAEEKGQATQEMEAIMDAASSDTAEIDLLLDENAPKEEALPKEPDTDGIDDIPDVLEETPVPEAVPEERTTPAADEPAPAEAVVDESDTAVPEEDSADSTDGEDEDEDELAATEPAPDEEAQPAADDKAEESAEYKKLGLYLHIPFCKSKCAYCDFYSSDKIVCEGRKTPEEMKLYCTALKNNMRIISERTTQYNVDTVFIGGGTPTALPAKLLLNIVKEVENDFYLDENCEFTVEMNPATADARLLKKLRRAGVNRLSIGLQSAHNHELAALSRIHTAGDFTECFQMAREAGFDNINIDVMYGIPEQTKGSFMETLAFVASMKPEHISMYNLRIEDGTPFGEKKHMLPLPDEDTECDMYFDGIDYLASQGYHQYEISNFARDGYECRHNLRYWRGEEYIGCGPAAHSYFGGRRFSLRRSLAQYCKLLETKGTTIPSSLLDESYVVDRKEEVAEYLMLRLRLKEGISTDDFRAHFGADFDEIFGRKLRIYIENGFMTHENGHYAFTPQGMFVSNEILSRIIPFETKYEKGGKNS
ncbi:MAG: radical SAM family heme chaperone HemW [Ruminococcaceae bacterium]|nr:radical SAM family heme chaperone HemW [Oscillospiraceae bacterium]